MPPEGLFGEEITAEATEISVREEEDEASEDDDGIGRHAQDRRRRLDVSVAFPRVSAATSSCMWTVSQDAQGRRNQGLLAVVRNHAGR